MINNTCLNLKKLYVHNKFCLWKLGINLNPFPQLSVIPTERLSGLFSKEGQRDEERGEFGIILIFPDYIFSSTEETPPNTMPWVSSSLRASWWLGWGPSKGGPHGEVGVRTWILSATPRAAAQGLRAPPTALGGPRKQERCSHSAPCLTSLSASAFSADGLTCQ